MNDQKPVRLKKHNGMWALREVLLGYAAARIAWPPGQFLYRKQDKLFIRANDGAEWEWSVSCFDLRRTDWANPDALKDYREAMKADTVRVIE